MQRYQKRILSRSNQINDYLPNNFGTRTRKFGQWRYQEGILIYKLDIYIEYLGCKKWGGKSFNTIVW